MLTSCTESYQVQLESEVKVYLSDNSEKVIILTKKDKEYINLNQWLVENQSNWYSTSGRYPGGVYVKSGSHGIQVTKLQVVLYSTEGKEPVAIKIQNLKKGDLTDLRNLFDK